MSSTPRDYTARDFASLRSALIDYIRKTRPDLWTDFYQANLGVVLLDLLAYVGDVAAFGQDAALLETFLSTARRYESGLDFARSVGYRPRQARPATCTVLATVPPGSNLLLYGGKIVAGSRVAGDNGYSYEFVEDVAISPGQSQVRAVIVQGQTFRESFPAPTGTVNPTVTCRFDGTAQDSWVVYVGDTTDPANIWTMVDSVATETSATSTYEVSFDARSRLTIRFGDGVAGKIPDQSVTVVYRTCAGSSGNAAAQTIRGAVRVDVNPPSGGQQSLDFVNYDDTPANASAVNIQRGEKTAAVLVGGVATQQLQLTNSPARPGTVKITVPFSGGGNIVLTDDGAGNLVVESSTATVTDPAPPFNVISVAAGYIEYTSGLCDVVLSFALPVGAAGRQFIADYEYFVTVDPLPIAVVGAATGGDDRESLDSMRSTVPAYIRSQDRLITIKDYNLGLLRVPGVALSLTDARPISYVANIVRLNIWSAETVNFSTAVDAAGLYGSGKYRRYAIAPNDAVSRTAKFVGERTLLTTHHLVQTPGILWVDFYLGPIVYDSRSDAQGVRDAITAAIVSVFEASGGFAIRLSDIYSAVYAVPGVFHFTLQRATTGTRASDDAGEEVAVTAASPTVSASLLSVGPSRGDAVCSPGTLRLIIEQGSERYILDDNRVGGFTHVGGTNALLSGSVDYATGAISLTFSSSLAAGGRVVAYYNNITNDYRQRQRVFVDSVDMGDAWPHPAQPTLLPVDTGSRKYDGRPLSPVPAGVVPTGSITFSALPADGVLVTINDGTTTLTFEFDTNSAVTPGNVQVIVPVDTVGLAVSLAAIINASSLTMTATAVSGQPTIVLSHDATGTGGNHAITTNGPSVSVSGMAGGTSTGGATEYDALKDILVESALLELRFYDNTYIYDNSFYFDSEMRFNEDIRAINLRKLDFTLVART